MSPSEMLQIYRKSLPIITNIAINALIFFIFFFIEHLFNTYSVISLISATLFIILFNIVFWWINIFSYIKELMQEFNVNPKLIEIEITESILLDDSRYNLNVLNKLIDMGFNLSLDDFGTGFNSLKYLLQVPINSIKIDKSFIDGLPNNKNSIAIVRAVITLCHNLEKKVIAEGIETIEQAQFLKKEGCDEIQGYYCSKPLPIDDLKILISKHKKWLFHKNTADELDSAP